MDAKLPMHEQLHRRTTRVLLRIPIKVRGIGANGQPFDEETFTVMIDGHGAEIALKNPPRPGERLTITNLRSGKSCPFRLVRRISKSPSREAEWGVECLQAGANFWGIYFPTKASPPLPAETEIIEAWLECHQCGSQEMAQLTLEEYKTLGKQPFLKRGCAQCAAPTDWGYSYIETEETFLVDPMLSSGPAPSGGIEKRKAKRLTLKLPVRIRLADGQEATAGTENLSKIGLCVISGARMNVGDIIRLIFGYTEPGGGTEVLGQVVRRQELAGTSRALYGVHLEERS
jgi:hypothetical protein